MRLSAVYHSNRKINEAARTLLPILEKKTFSASEGSLLIPATWVIAEWRGTFAYPLRVMSNLLRHQAQSLDEHALISSRMKRLESMLIKLRRNPSMQITQMQDIGGCRAVLSSVEQVRSVTQRFKVAIAERLQEPGENDYISTPKADGYRSVHLVVRYESRVHQQMPSRKIEIQLRSRLQHQWANAVETVDLFTTQMLKTGRGQPEWRRFFALASSLFALKEKCPLVSGTPKEYEEIAKEISPLSKKLKVYSLLSEWIAAIRINENINENPRMGGPHGFYLIRTNVQNKISSITTFRLEDAEAAQLEYAKAEQMRITHPHVHAVLCRLHQWPNSECFIRIITPIRMVS